MLPLATRPWSMGATQREGKPNPMHKRVRSSDMVGVDLGQGGGKVPLTSCPKSCNRLRMAFPEPS